MSLGPNYRKLFAASTISNLGDGVGQIAYPWLASAVTRNPMLIAVVVVAQKLPWLVFTLPAGVITDRLDRRRIMIVSNAARAVLTAVVALAVVWRGGQLPGPDELDTVVDTEVVLYVCVILATLMLGVAEVLYDNTAQTFMPNIVQTSQLERANGRLWAAEQVMNSFAGPPLASLLLAVGFALPFVVDAGSFAVSAALIFSIAATPKTAAPTARRPWREEAREGFAWLWRHDLLRTLAIVLGLLNATSNATAAILVLFAQEVLDTSPTEFAILMTSGAVGAVIGGWTASAIHRRIGSGPSLWVCLGTGVVTNAVIGSLSWWPGFWIVFVAWSTTVVLWNVITVSLRQTIIPDRLLGRVNSVYRFFGWGMIPIGALIGGLIVSISGLWVERETALRIPWFVAAVSEGLLLLYAAPRLTTARMDAARAEAAARSTDGEPGTDTDVVAPSDAEA